MSQKGPDLPSESNPTSENSVVRLYPRTDGGIEELQKVLHLSREKLLFLLKCISDTCYEEFPRFSIEELAAVYGSDSDPELLESHKEKRRLRQKGLEIFNKKFDQCVRCEFTAQVDGHPLTIYFSGNTGYRIFNITTSIDGKEFYTSWSSTDTHEPFFVTKDGSPVDPAAFRKLFHQETDERLFLYLIEELSVPVG